MSVLLFADVAESDALLAVFGINMFFTLSCVMRMRRDGVGSG